MAKKVSEEPKKEEKKYPSLILGLDISTACIGISIIYDDGINEPKVALVSHIVPKISNKIKGIEALILRKEIFENEFLSKYKDQGITECIIESPLTFATGNSNAQTVSQLLQFNGLLSEAIYRVLHIVPTYVSSFDARMQSFPQLVSIRKYNKKGEIYPLKHILKSIKDNSLTLFGSYPFDCDKKSIMMNMVCEKYTDIEWKYGKTGDLKKENYDACDALVCALAYANSKKYGEIVPKVVSHKLTETPTDYIIDYVMDIWGKKYDKKIILNKEELKAVEENKKAKKQKKDQP